MQQLISAKDRLIVALDVPTLEEAIELIRELKTEVGMFKAGLELYSHCGLALFQAISAEGVPFFFDCKFHDIPNTVGRASSGLVGQGITMFNVHAFGGREMMKAAAKGTREAAGNSLPIPKIIAVTVLTSMGETELHGQLGYTEPLDSLVVRLALLAKEAGLDGVVASARESASIRKACGPDFLIVTPGIRAASAEADDQRRTVTARQAVKDGSDYIVVGRPITQAKNRKEAARQIVEEMESSAHAQ